MPCRTLATLACCCFTVFFHALAAGQQLNASLGRGGQLQGFMRVEAVLVSQTGGNIHGPVLLRLHAPTCTSTLLAQLHDCLLSNLHVPSWA